MALTLAIKGKGVIANCDQLTNDTGGTGTGDWSEQGGGTMTLSPDVYLFGSGSIGGQYATKSGFQQFDLGAGNELDFTGGTGAEAGQMIFMWVNMAAFGALDTLANYGLAIRISSSSPGTSNYRDYVIAGSNDSNGWTGGWKLFVIDPDIAGTRESGTCDISAIRTIGVWIDTASSVRAESLWIDQIAVGEGLIVKAGTSTEGWKEIVDYCTDYANRAWGMWQEKEGIYYTYGKTYIGDYYDQTGNIDFADAGRIIQFGKSEFWDGSAWVTSYREYRAGIKIADSSLYSYDTDFTDGYLVGSDAGRGGSTIIGNDTLDVKFEVAAARTNSQVKLYNTTLKRLLDGVIWAGYTENHVFFGGAVIECGLASLDNTVKIRNILFVATQNDYGLDAIAENGSALQWTTGMDIEKCQFIANVGSGGVRHAIQHGSAITADYKGLIFSGNDYDVHFTASSGNLVINNLAPTGGGQKSNASTYQSIYGGSVTFNSSFTHTLTGLKQYSEVTYTKKPTPYDTLTGLACVAGQRRFLDIVASWTTDEFKGKLLVVTTAGANAGRYYVTSNNNTEIYVDKVIAETDAPISATIYGAFDVVDHTEDVPADGENEYVYSYAAGTYVDIIIFHVNYEDVILEDINLGEADQTIPITQIPDVNYYNPT